LGLRAVTGEPSGPRVTERAFICDRLRGDSGSPGLRALGQERAPSIGVRSLPAKHAKERALDGDATVVCAEDQLEHQGRNGAQ
jgi:hypothetical protein